MRADAVMQRASALTIHCSYCGAKAGERCFDPRDGVEIERQPAHNIRMREAQVL